VDLLSFPPQAPGPEARISGQKVGNMKNNHRALTADEKWKLLKWIEGNKEMAFLKSEAAAAAAALSLGFSVSPSSILTHRSVVHPGMKRKSPTYRPGAKTFSEFVSRIERIEKVLSYNWPIEWNRSKEVQHDV
jgi:hypothetical protein